jgi:hypothetical protein
MSNYVVTVKRTVYQTVTISDVEADTPDEARSYVEQDLKRYRERLENHFDVEYDDSETEIESVVTYQDDLRKKIAHAEERLEYAENFKLFWERDARKRQLVALQEKLARWED